MLFNEPTYCIEFHPVESPCLLESNRIQPKFRHLILSSHMDMGRFATVKGNEEETVRAYPQGRRH